ncbi:unnamed protein product [Leuciscus chuanchicus]
MEVQTGVDSWMISVFVQQWLNVALLHYSHLSRRVFTFTGPISTESDMCEAQNDSTPKEVELGAGGQVGRQLFLQYTAITQKSQMGNLNTSERGLPFEREGLSVSAISQMSVRTGRCHTSTTTEELSVKRKHSL